VTSAGGRLGVSADAGIATVVGVDPLASGTARGDHRTETVAGLLLLLLLVSLSRLYTWMTMGDCSPLVPESGFSGHPSVDDGVLPNGGFVWHTRWSLTCKRAASSCGCRAANEQVDGGSGKWLRYELVVVVVVMESG
jgi:hypothetical protein